MSDKNIYEVTLPKQYYIIKDIDCPNCHGSFKAPTVRKQRLKLKDIHENLRPEYVDVEPTLYEVMFCPHCGYTRLVSEFDNVTDLRRKLYRDEIGIKFTKRPNNVSITLDQALERYKFALITAKAMSLPASEIAFLFYKLSWLKQIKNDENGYLNAIAKSYTWFEKAIFEEDFPLQNIDENTTHYLMSVFAKDFGDYTIALKHCSEVLISPTTSEKLKSRARDLKFELVKLKEKYPMGKNILAELMTSQQINSNLQNIKKRHVDNYIKI